jgi:hypothetical protein
MAGFEVTTEVGTGPSLEKHKSLYLGAVMSSRIKRYSKPTC